MRIVTVVGATGRQGGAVVRSLVETGKYKIRAVTRDATSAKAQAIKRLSENIEMVTCDINQSDDVKRAFKDSWAIYSLTDYWAQVDRPEMEIHQGKLMADIAASLQISYYIFSTVEDVNKLSGGKLDLPHFTQKAQIRDYIKEKYPNLKTIYVEPACYMQNWQGFSKPQKLDDGTILFASPLDQKATLHLVDIDDTGAIVREILNDPEKYVNQDICICAEEIPFGDIPKIFTKVTGIPATGKTLTENEYRAATQSMPKSAQDDLFNTFKWFEQSGYYGKDKDWKNGQKLTRLNTFEQCTEVGNLLCQLSDVLKKKIYLTLQNIENYPTSLMINSNNNIERFSLDIENEWTLRCTRGLNIRVRMNDKDNELQQYCQTKFHVNLLYSTRPRDNNKNYSVRIDVSNKPTLNYRASWIFPILFPFLLVCPIGKFGSLCYLRQISCEQNNGLCMLENLRYSYSCICPEDYDGIRCEFRARQIHISFADNFVIPDSLSVHFIETNDNSPHIRTTTMTRISPHQTGITIYELITFNAIFAQFDKKYYLIFVQESHILTGDISTKTIPSHQCLSMFM
ncbi:hypothetical protein I4U23_011266 [Adineta vaga]|nr:hypothetical protein I4U23_011266 [Adineta vaga]